MNAHKIADIINAFRIIPRIMISLYGYMCYQIAMWFMVLPDPSGTQVAFVSTVWGGAAVWFGLYVNSGNWTKKE